ncbi:rhamnogalacturonan lyase family protein [Viscerimonas tarda]
MKKLLLLFLVLFSMQSAYAQRQMEHLDRGVVAINKGGNQLFISWRLFATDPDNIAFNVYRQLGVATPVKLNASPVTNSTNLLSTVSGLTGSASRIFVKPVINGIEGAEEGSWNLPVNAPNHRIVQDFNLEPIPGVAFKYAMKFCWPADLDGDGKYDFVMDRQNYGASDESEEEVNDINFAPAYVEAYSSAGAFKWRVCAGPNVKICAGMSDMVVAYDMDGDGKAEVLMKTSEGATFADGTVIKGTNGQVTDYRPLNKPAPHFLSIINGETGVEIDRIEMANKAFLNKPNLYGDWGYKQLFGNFGIAYLDGIHPSLVFEQANRNSDKSFNHAVTAWDFKEGKLVERWNWVDEAEKYARFHQIRIADVDGDGFDEMIEGGFVLDHDGAPLFNTDLGHGDRHRTTDIDPDRPGLETFAIQQDNLSTLGMALYDAATGEMIKRWYQGAVGDVGRGECIDMDNTSRGLEMFSTMNGYYDSKGNLLVDGATLHPAEGIWWDGDLLREELSPIGKEGFNVAINKWNSSTKGFVRETPNLYNEKSAYYAKAEYGGRPAFFGDLLGDWREELVLMRRDTTGFCVISNWAVTDKRLYCLMQNPGYRMQTTTRGYYQSPYPDYYLAYDMPAPPVAPVQKADEYFTTGNVLTAAYANDKSLMFDLRNPATSVAINENISPSRIWMINPKGKDYEFTGTGILTGSMDLIKSQQGTFTLNGDHTYTGNTRISEGKVILNGSLTAKVVVEARGIIAGNASLNGGIELNEGLNYMGGRIEPGNGCEAAKLGTVLIQGDMNGKGRNCFAFDIVPSSAKINDKITINGDFNVTGNNNTLEITFSTEKPEAGIYTLIEFTGATNASIANFAVKGLVNTPYELLIADNKVTLEVKATRAATAVTWSGAASSAWDFSSFNFKAGTDDVFFVPEDEVTFNDEASNKTVVLTESMPAAATIFTTNATYTLSGAGGISGAGTLKKEGAGTLKINTTNNTYSGATIVSGGTLEAVSVGNAGDASSLGAGSSLEISGATLRLSGISASSRSITMSGIATIDLSASSASLMASGNINGSTADFVKTGAGLINLQGNNTFRSVTLKQGTIFLGSIAGNRYGLGNATVTMEGGTLRLLDINETANTFDSPFNMVLPEGKTARLEGSSRWKMSGKLTGSGTLNLAIPYVRFDLNGNWSAFEGQINLSTARTAGADFRIGNDYGYGKATINVGQYMSVYHLSTGKTIKIGALSGDAGSYLSGNSTTWQVGGNNASGLSFKGVLSGTSSRLIKEGAGSLTLTGDNTYTGTTEVNAGSLIVANTAGSATGTGNVTVKSGARLEGTGSIAGIVTVASNGYVYLQDAKCSKIDIGKNLLLQAGSILAIELNPAAAQSDVVNAVNVSIAGALEIARLGTGTFQTGMEFKLLNVTGTITGSFTQISPLPGEGLEWDQSRIAEGIIAVKTATGISSATSERVKIYPNPVKDKLNIHLGDYNGPAKIRIVSVDGSVCLDEEKQAAEYLNMDVSKLAAGVYILNVSWEDGRYSGTIIKK